MRQSARQPENSAPPGQVPGRTNSVQPSVPATHANVPPSPPDQPPVQFPEISSGSDLVQTRHHHHPRDHFIANTVALTSGLCLLALTGGLFAWALRQPQAADSTPASEPSRSVASRESTAIPTPRRRIRDRVDRRRLSQRQASPPPTNADFSAALEGSWRVKRAPESPFVSNVSFAPQTEIDKLVMQKLIELGIQPAKLCSDEVFLRRLYIDTLGTLPKPDEAQAFLDDTDPDKRAKLVEHVLQRPEFADYWAMKWCDILRVKAEFPIKLWPNAAQAYHRWVRTAIKDNMPYDEFARQLLTSSGSNFRAPQVNFYRAVQSKTPETLASAVALTFLCQRTENWPPEQLEGMSVFFSQVAYKGTGEWKEEIVFFDRRQGRESNDREPLTAVLPNGEKIQIPPGQDPRRVFTEWLVNDQNPEFARAIANRVWYWLLGRGIVDPPDDVRPDNVASNPPLLNYLGEELVAADYDLRHLCRLILNSQTYQLACTHETRDPLAAQQFAYYHVRRLDAEVLIDAICQITGTSESYSSIIPEPFTFLPEGHRAIALPDGSITSPFLEMFGRPSRDTGLESDRNNRLTAGQALHLLNSNHLRNKLKQGPGLKQVLSQATGSVERVELLYLTILSRRPTDEESAMVEGLCGYDAGARDVAWALINSDEFLFRH